MSGQESRPLQIILDVRVAVAQSATSYQAALHGLPTDATLKQLRKEWHIRVLAYYREIARHSSKSNIKHMWHEDDEELGSSLEEIKNEQFKTETVEVEKYDNRNKTTKRVKQEQMKTFDEEKLLRLTELLDKAVASLGFDADVSSEIKRFGYKGEHNESP